LLLFWRLLLLLLLLPHVKVHSQIIIYYLQASLC
jgi:hypothetical protein